METRLSDSEEVSLIKRGRLLSNKESLYYQDLFYRVLKIGTELEFARPKKVDINELRTEIIKLMKPSGDLNNLGELGVYDVIKEHCGIEIQIIGRHPHWNALMNQYRQIISILIEKKVRMRPTCGLHFHLIAVGLAETIPEIILANLWNLVRRHAAGLKFIFSGGEVPHGICRRRQHNAHQEFMNQSPANLRMHQIKNNLKNSLTVPEHQNFFNLEHIIFDPGGELKNFHVELRFPDGDLSPTSIVAKTFLFFAMVLKSVEISKYGLIDVGNPDTWDRKKELMDFLSNNDGDLARSDTSRIGEKEIRELQANGMDLLILLKSVFNKFSNPAYSILKKLIRKPISLRRIEEDNWQFIDQALALDAKYPTFLDDTDTEIIKIIELGLAGKKDSIGEWLDDVSKRINMDPGQIKRRIDNYIEKYPVWDEELGSFVFQR